MLFTKDHQCGVLPYPWRVIHFLFSILQNCLTAIPSPNLLSFSHTGDVFNVKVFCMLCIPDYQSGFFSCLWRVICLPSCRSVCLPCPIQIYCQSDILNKFVMLRFHCISCICHHQCGILCYSIWPF